VRLPRTRGVGWELTRSVGEVPRVWLLDEVTGLRGWTQALKYLRDNTELDPEHSAAFLAREQENPKETEQAREGRERECEAHDEATVESYRRAGAGKRPAREVQWPRAATPGRGCSESPLCPSRALPAKRF
jgi:hypothetical protein